MKHIASILLVLFFVNTTLQAQTTSSDSIKKSADHMVMYTVKKNRQYVLNGVAVMFVSMTFVDPDNIEGNQPLWVMAGLFAVIGWIQGVSADQELRKAGVILGGEKIKKTPAKSGI